MYDCACMSKKMYLGIVAACLHICLLFSAGECSQLVALLRSRIIPYILHGCLYFNRYYRCKLRVEHLGQVMLCTSQWEDVFEEGWLSSIKPHTHKQLSIILSGSALSLDHWPDMCMSLLWI